MHNNRACVHKEVHFSNNCLLIQGKILYFAAEF